jgi:hypothetical protein
MALDSIALVSTEKKGLFIACANGMRHTATPGRFSLASFEQCCNLVICAIEVAAETEGGEGLKVLVAGAGSERKRAARFKIRASLKVG